ncbi:uncharacterized protein LOC134276801 isoform X1 [Saccostrea cucullata]|uniref:uncharacterized protein LOC134276801 isoform X1 n=1 Tax=Saccostrea cuccullata TaxID=36930 RepID=UPI002ED4E360
MFLNKIVGVARESLLEQLNQYYRIGVACLLHSPTLRDILMPALSRPSFVIPCTEEQSIDLECQSCINVFMKYEVSALHRIDFTDWFFYLKYVDTSVYFSLSPYHLLTLQHYKADFLILSAFMIFNNATHFKHKYMYYLDRNLCSMLKLSSRIGTISHSLYLALYYYRTGRYSKALYVTYLTKQRLSKPYILYHDHTEGHRFGNDISYLSLSREMNISWVEEIKLYCAVHYIEELAIEKNVKGVNDFILLSPFVLVEMLSVLSNYRLDNRSQYLESLTDLHTLLLYDDGRYVPLKLRDISWYILGICHQVVGDNKRALDSYHESLRQEQFNEIQNAVKFRKHYLQQRLIRNIQM